MWSWHLPADRQQQHVHSLPCRNLPEQQRRMHAMRSRNLVEPDRIEFRF